MHRLQLGSCASCSLDMPELTSAISAARQSRLLQVSIPVAPPMSGFAAAHSISVCLRVPFLIATLTHLTISTGPPLSPELRSPCIAPGLGFVTSTEAG